jgi:hypothetical protein
MSLKYITEEELRSEAIKMLQELPVDAVKDFLHRHLQGEFIGPLSVSVGREHTEGKYFYAGQPNPRHWNIGYFGQRTEPPDIEQSGLPEPVRKQLKEMKRRLESLKQRSSGFGLNYDEQLGYLRGAHHVLSEIVGIRESNFWLYQWWQANLY